MIAVAIIVLFVVAILVWNFVPGVRDKLKGWTTILEAIGMVLLQGLGVVAEALQEAQKAGYIPPALVGTLPFIVLAWFVFKRVKTTTPVGKK